MDFFPGIACRPCRLYLPSGKATASSRKVASQSRHTVEVSVQAGELCESLVSHHCHDEGIPMQESRLSREVSSQRHVCGTDCKRGHTSGVDFVQGLPGANQLLDFRRMSAQTV